MSILKPFEQELKLYCEQNSLDYRKIVSAPKCGNDKILFIQHIDKNKAANGLKDETPAEVLITVMFDKNGKIQFKKGTNADGYLHL